MDRFDEVEAQKGLAVEGASSSFGLLASSFSAAEFSKERFPFATTGGRTNSVSSSSISISISCASAGAEAGFEGGGGGGWAV